MSNSVLSLLIGSLSKVSYYKLIELNKLNHGFLGLFNRASKQVCESEKASSDAAITF